MRNKKTKTNTNKTITLHAYQNNQSIIMSARGIFTLFGSILLILFIIISIYTYFTRYRQSHLFHALSTNARDITNAFELPNADGTEYNENKSRKDEKDIEGKGDPAEPKGASIKNNTDGKSGINKNNSAGDYIDFEII